MTPTDARRIAERIAKALFTNGAGEKANRLELKDINERGLGGWGFEPAVRHITRILTETEMKQ